MLDFCIKAFATWRIAHMITEEYGPFGIFKKIRELFGVNHDSDGNVVDYPTNSPIVCMWCVSVWIGLVLTIVPNWLIKPFAYSAVALLVDGWRK